MRRLKEAGSLWEALRRVQGSEFARQQRLRSQFDGELVVAALQLEEARRKAAAKFQRADSMWFDRVGVEQSTSETVARHKAQRFEGEAWDLCCGIGGDTIAMAERATVHAVDQSSAQCLRTLWNAEVHGVENHVTTVTAGVESIPVTGAIVHIDPDRRPAGRNRSLRIEDSIPGLPYLESLMVHAKAGAIKLSPASNFPGKFPDAEVELISLEGECKEATVWFGEFGTPGIYRATVLPTGDSIAGRPLEWVAPVTALQSFLLDPDPAVVRAGLVDLLAVQLDLQRLDEAEEYLTADRNTPSPFYSTFEVIASLPNSPKEIRAWFRSSNVGQVEIKCRHIPINAEAMRRSLPLPGTEAATLIFARVQGKARAVVCRRLVRGTV